MSTYFEPGRAPLVVHVINYLAAGGLENGLVNLINHMPPSAYRHAIVCLIGHTEFRRRITRDDVTLIDLGKAPGRDVEWYGQLWKAFRRLRPAIVHTRNLCTLEGQMVAAIARVPGRVHGEHGRDMWDLDGTNRKYNVLRRAVRPCVHRYVAVTADLEGWLTSVVQVPPRKVTRVYNGVDSSRFFPRAGARPPLGGPGFAGDESFIIGTVGRMAEVKDQITLARAFIHLVQTDRRVGGHLRLVMVGDGPLRARCRELLEAHGVGDRCWLPGDREDIPELLRALDLFVLPSIAEGMSNTILEAMATGLPVIATNVGGNPEVVRADITGTLVRQGDHEAIADAIRAYVAQPTMRLQRGAAARARVVSQFSLNTMVDAYRAVYDDVLSRAKRPILPKADVRAASAVGSEI